ncbi:MAG: MFS transporter [Actinomycetales bacterium]|nr:MFS transporter [Actinomycetales bacterium]
MTSSLAPEQIARARNGDLVVFAANGLILSSWLSRLPGVKQQLGLTPGQLGWLLLALSAGAVIGLPLAGHVAHRLGAARTVRLGVGVALPGMLLAALAVQAQLTPILVAVGLFLFGLGSGNWDVAQNLEGSVIEQALGRSIMPWFHAAFSGGTVLGALIGAAASAAGIPIMVIVTAVAVAWGTARFLPGTVGAHEDHAEPLLRDRQRSAWLEPRTLLIGIMVLAAAFTEGVANDWLAVAFVDGHDLANAAGALALAVFLAFMTAGRLAGPRLLDRYGRVGVLRVLFTAAIVGCLLVVLGGAPLAFLGAAIWGLGASLGFPVGMSAAADDPRRAALRISVVSTIGYVAFLAGPPIVGFLGDRFGVLDALLVVAVVSVAAILVTPAARPLRRSP